MFNKQLFCSAIMPKTTPDTQKKQQTLKQSDVPWNVVVLNDPVNLQDYVALVFKKVFGYSQAKAETLMMEVHTQGRSIVWTGGREKAEFYVQQLHGWQLQTTMEKEG
ncbi:MAG: ATP-dependent Clp protease adapter ClpS [Verrucomicrobiaceae bacterium]|nr:ATP-dependent Clp protease adapter ClpS [Verrucomicrobiaceae bacterium]